MNTRTPTGQGISARTGVLLSPAPFPCSATPAPILIYDLVLLFFVFKHARKAKMMKKRSDARVGMQDDGGVMMLSIMLRRAVLLSSSAEGCTKLNAFDNALLNAGIGNANLVRMSSVVPEDVEWLNEVPEFPIGTVVFAVYTHIESDEEGARISAAVGVGIRAESAGGSAHTHIHHHGSAKMRARGGGGLIYEFSGFCSAEHAARKVKGMLSEGFAVRGWKMSEMRVAVAEHIVRDKPGCALAAVAFFP